MVHCWRPRCHSCLRLLKHLVIVITLAFCSCFAQLNPQSSTELLRLTLETVEKGNFLQVLVLLAVASSPWLIAVASAWWMRWRAGKLYERMIADKDKEIERQAKRIKQLENLTLPPRP